MALDRVLSQDEIDRLFRAQRDSAAEDDPASRALTYDFRRPDRIAKDQLRAIHLLHENFARTLASSLSAYLRAYVIVNLVSVEQLSFLEFTQCLPSPSLITSLKMKPLDNSAVLELNPSLVFPIIEILLGGAGSSASALRVEREATEIEQSIIEGVLRIILHDLQNAWQAVTALEFSVDATETEPQMLQLLAPTEAVVAISLEVRVGEAMGMMNIGIPSITVKMLRQKFDQQWSVKRSESRQSDKDRILHLVRDAAVTIDARLDGPSIRAGALLNLKPGDVVAFDYQVSRPLQATFNAKTKYTGRVVAAGHRRAFRLDSLIRPGKESTAASKART